MMYFYFFKQSLNPVNQTCVDIVKKLPGFFVFLQISQMEATLEVTLCFWLRSNNCSPFNPDSALYKSSGSYLALLLLNPQLHPP